MKYLFLDTNIFLHYRHFEDIPWKTVVCDDFTLVVAPIVLDELDKHKDREKGKIQKRAKRVSSLLYEVLMNGKECKVPILYCKEPVPTKEDSEKMDLSTNDNRLILSALKSEYNISDIIIISGDKGIQFRAASNGLAHILLPDTYRLPLEKTDEEKEIERLKEELKTVTERVPEPGICFADGSSRLVIERYCEPDIAKLIEEKMVPILEQFPPRKKETGKPRNELQALALAMSELGGLSYEGYDEDREKYLQEERTLLELETKRDCLEERFKKVSFTLFNNGKAEIGSEVIYIKLPDDVKVYTRKESRESHEYLPPVKPSFMFRGEFRETARQISMMPAPFSGKRNVIWMWNPDKPSDTGGVYKLSEDNLLQHLSKSLGLSFYIDAARVDSFSIQWAIVDSELADPVVGELTVEVKT